jgi:hypothetical protein
MAKFVPDPGERIIRSGSIGSLQGSKMKFPVHTRYYLTDRRFVWHDMGRWAFIHSQGALWMLLIRGKPVSMPYSGMKITHGRYAMNKDLLLFSTPDGRGVLVSRREKTLEMLKEALGQAGISLVQNSSEEWCIRA